jgi:hypothetical protein
MIYEPVDMCVHKTTPGNGENRGQSARYLLYHLFRTGLRAFPPESDTLTGNCGPGRYGFRNYSWRGPVSTDSGVQRRE